MDQVLNAMLSVSDQGGTWLMIRVGNVWCVGTKLTTEQVEEVTRIVDYDKKVAAPSNDTLPSGRSLC